jgi:hypothetical protein
MKKQKAGKAKPKTTNKASKSSKKPKAAPKGVAKAKSAAKTTTKTKPEAHAKKVADASSKVRKGSAATGVSPASTRPLRRPSRKGGGHRRESRVYPPGELLLPGGPQSRDEVLYLFRGCVAAEHPAADQAMADIVAKRALSESDPVRDELVRDLTSTFERFAEGAFDPALPGRTSAKRTFAGVVERVKVRRREIGAFLRGLDIGKTEVSHLDSHGETSLQNLMEWTARIEKMVEEGEEPENADYIQIHRGLDQLDATTEGLIVDIELTLRRLRERAS